MLVTQFLIDLLNGAAGIEVEARHRIAASQQMAVRAVERDADFIDVLIDQFTVFVFEEFAFLVARLVPLDLHTQQAQSLP